MLLKSRIRALLGQVRKRRSWLGDVGVVTLLNGCVAVLAFGKDLLLASFFGTSVQADALTLAYASVSASACTEVPKKEASSKSLPKASTATHPFNSVTTPTSPNQERRLRTCPSKARIRLFNNIVVLLRSILHM